MPFRLTPWPIDRELRLESARRAFQEACETLTQRAPELMQINIGAQKGERGPGQG